MGKHIDRSRLQKYETNLQQIQGITHYCIQALHDPTDNCETAVENDSRLNVTVVVSLFGVWGRIQYPNLLPPTKKPKTSSNELMKKKQKRKERPK